ncbi:MAG: hypothetical protein FWE20_06870 [Defluviitaleaceae bacterium]|nr:hypothetical protein [Defluviitaleaceae bacterium]
MRKLLSRPVNYIIPLVVAFFNFLLILFPGDIVEAARTGLLLWFNNVLPALLPFIIGTNILAAVGFVGLLGKLLDPVMMALFRVPGAGGFALVTGMMSGYPMGAKTAATLVQSGQVSASQGWRLAAFCNNSGPLFILGAVGAGLFSNAGVGYFIMFCHYAGAIAAGLVTARFAGRETGPGRLAPDDKSTLVYVRETRKRPKPFGEILGTSVKNAMETIVVVGGYIVLFAVIVRVLDILGTFEVAQALSQPFLEPLGVDAALLAGIMVGMVEMTNGSLRLSEAGITAHTIAALTFVISFGGFSIHAQSVSFLSKAGVSAGGYIAGKLLHGLISAGLAFAAFGLFGITPREAAPAFFQGDAPIIRVFGYSSALFLISIIGFIALAAICRVLVKKRRRRF